MADAAFVFIYLPGQVRPTVAGRFELETATSPPVGELVYGELYLANPAALPLGFNSMPAEADSI